MYIKGFDSYLVKS